MKEIQLTKGKVALVDDEDFEWLSQWKWSTAKAKHGNLYARRFKDISMHTEIMKVSKGMEIDHKDGNGLNNQKNNLRVCTHAQNMSNLKRRKDNTSGYKGVSRHGLWWRARLVKNGIQVYCKMFSTSAEAARAYDIAAKEYFGEFANLNFPE